MNQFLSRFDDPIPLKLGRLVRPAVPLPVADDKTVKWVPDSRTPETDTAHPLAAKRYFWGMKTLREPLGQCVWVLDAGATYPQGTVATTRERYEAFKESQRTMPVKKTITIHMPPRLPPISAGLSDQFLPGRGGWATPNDAQRAAWQHELNEKMRAKLDAMPMGKQPQKHAGQV